MANNGRIPIPKTQRELSISQHTPLNMSGPGFQPTGNPNNSNGLNRGRQISFDNDTTKPFSIGIQDIDESILYYFTNVIKPFVIQNGTRIPVPVIYGSPEKWKSFQKDGYYRDAQGRIMMPIIMFKRDNIDKVRTIANKLDANNPNNVVLSRKRYSRQNAYDNFSVLNNVIPQKTNYAVVVPDYITLTYSCAINTYYMDQLNKIIEAIEYASDSYWGDPSRFQFRAMIDSFAIQTEISDNAERVVSSTFSIKMNGYIIPEVLQKDVTALKKVPDVVKIIVEEQILGEDIKVSAPVAPPKPWIMANGFWNDNYYWDDNAVWIDGPQNWIMATGYWNDNNYWDDNAVWVDGPQNWILANGYWNDYGYWNDNAVWVD